MHGVKKFWKSVIGTIKGTTLKHGTSDCRKHSMNRDEGLALLQGQSVLTNHLNQYHLVMDTVRCFIVIHN